MPVRVHCPHCISPCLVADKYLGGPVQCHKCGEAFTVRPPSAAALPRTDPGTRLRSGPPRLTLGSATSAGRVRQNNEDSFLVKHQTWFNDGKHCEVALLVVADGMGGHQDGELASGIVIRTVGTALAPLIDGSLGGPFADSGAAAVAETIDYALQEANREVFRKAKARAPGKGMGATAVVALVRDGHVFLGHVGDCRAYHYHAGQLTQVTRDQTLVARMVELGKLTPEEARTHPARHDVTQAVGHRFDLQPNRHTLQLVPGDWLILSCDGLHAHVDDKTLKEKVGRPAASAWELAHQLVDLADHGGGSDNCTVITARCE